MLSKKKNIHILNIVIVRLSIIVSVAFVIWFSIFWAKNKYTFNNQTIIINGASVLNVSNYKEYIKSSINSDSTNLESNFILERLYKHPYIAAARISYRYPSKIIIDISERYPFAILNNDPMIMFDQDCFVLPNFENIDDYNIPILSRFNTAPELHPLGKQSLSIKIKKTISWLKELNKKYPDLYKNISEVTLASGDEIILILTENPTKIMLGNNNTLHKIEILKKFEKTLNKKKQITDYAYLDMRYDNQIIAKE